MKSGKTEKNFSREELTEESFEKLDIVNSPKPVKPNNIPKNARNYKKLSFPNRKKEESAERTSNHAINRGYDVYSLVRMIFKNTSPKTPIAELEALCYFIAQLIAGDDQVPDAHPYYNNQYEIIGLGIEEIPNFKTNRENPLQHKDTIVPVINQQMNNAAKTQTIPLYTKINNLIKHYDERDKLLQTPSTSYLGAGISFFSNVTNKVTKPIKNSLNLHVNPAKTAKKLEKELEKFKDPKLVYTYESINQFINSLKERRDHINQEIKTSSRYSENPAAYYGNELQHLAEIIKACEDLLDVTNKVVLDLDKVDAALKTGNVDLTSMADNALISPLYNKHNYAITALDMKNYRICERMGIALATRFLLQDTDGHNQNMSKDGWLIDFDMAKLRFLFRFRNPSIWDKGIRQPSDSMFIVTPNDITHFPNITDARYYYWPTYETLITESRAEKISWIHTIKENFYRQSDCEVFKNLEHNPTFRIHSQKTFLKYILLDLDTYRWAAKFNLRADQTFVDDDGTTKNLLSEIILDENNRIRDVKKALLNVKSFQELMRQHGPEVLDMIKHEIELYRSKRLQKLPDAPYLAALLRTLNLNEIENKYRDILQTLPMETSSKQNDVSMEPPCVIKPRRTMM